MSEWRDELLSGIFAENWCGNRKLKTENECSAIIGVFNLLSISAEALINNFAMQYVGRRLHLVYDAAVTGGAINQFYTRQSIG